MSLDHIIVVRGRGQNPVAIRRLVAKLSPALVPAAEDEASDTESELDLFFDGLGSIQIEVLTRGYQICVDGGRDGNRERFVELCTLADRIAAELGTVVDDDEAAVLVLEARDVTLPLASSVVVTLRDGNGNPLESAVVHLDFFASFLDPGGVPTLASPWKPALMSEDRCYEVRASAIEALLHDSTGTAFRRYRWPLDGYGRVRGVEIIEL